MTRVIRHAELRASPWKNGGGSSTELAVSPAGAGFADFDWRLSLATISKNGPFSLFPGVDRSLALVDGPSAVLDLDGTHIELGPDQPLITFRGEAAVTATVQGGASTDFNVMTRRARCHHRLLRHAVCGSAELLPAGELNVVFLAEGPRLSLCAEGEEPVELARHDAVVLDRAGRYVLTTEQAIVLVTELFFP